MSHKGTARLVLQTDLLSGLYLDENLTASSTDNSVWGRSAAEGKAEFLPFTLVGQDDQNQNCLSDVPPAISKSPYTTLLLWCTLLLRSLWL